MKAEQIIEQINERALSPDFITARFGNNWREHYKRMLDEKQVDIDNILDIAWRQGRRALLMEEAIRKLAD